MFKIAIGAVVIFALLSCMQTASAVDITVPQSITVEFQFNKPKDEITYYEKTVSFPVISHENYTITGSISYDGDDIKIPSTSYSIPHGTSTITLLIRAYPSASSDKFLIYIEGEKIDVNVEITYHAKLEVSSPSSFGTSDNMVPRTEASITATISEVYDYKAVDVEISPSSLNENDWVRASLSSDIVTEDSPVTITFHLKPGEHPDHNHYTWTFYIKSGTEDTRISPSTITIEAYILMPPKLGKLHDGDLEIKFDKPKGTVSKYDRYIDVRVRNEGDETMYFNSWFTEYPSGITIKIENPSGSVSGKSSENIGLHVIAPYDAPEGTYHGRLYIDAGGAGHGDVDITIVVKWPVDFIISSTSIYFTPSPPSIDFGPLELKESEYEKKSANITLTEFYRYKSVRNLRFSKSGEYGNWLKEEMDFAEIPPGESRNITLKIEPGLEAVPKDYSWKYDISAYEIGAKRMEIKAKIVPMNIPEMMEYLKSFRESILYKNYPSSEVIISNGIEMLEVVERSEIGAEDWKKIPVLMKGTLSLLSSLNDGIISSEEENYGKAVENLVSASVSASTIGSNSELNNWDISGYAQDISTGADKTTEDVLIDEAKKLEGRGWDIKKAVEHARAMDDISGLKDEENVLESALSYQYAATMYGLLNDKEKRIECNYEESLLMDEHDELVSDATDRRIKAENNISNSKENDLIRIGDIYLLLNPYKYDTFSESYGLAEKYLEDALKNYKVAGESLMSEDTEKKLNDVKREWSYILSLFLFACTLYGAAFFYTITRVIMGTMAYMRDMYEREVGDIVIT